MELAYMLPDILQWKFLFYSLFPQQTIAHFSSAWPAQLLSQGGGTSRWQQQSPLLSPKVYPLPLVFFKKYILLVMLSQLSHFSPFIPLCPATPLPSAFPPTPQFNSIGCKYKFFGFSVSYTILNLPLSLFYLPFMLLTHCSLPLPPCW